MAKLDFLQNVKTARNLFFHGVRTDHPPLDPKKVEGQLERAAIWLTPSSVRGFNARDFPELSPPVRAQLKESVERFLGVAKKAPPTKPATPGQLKDAMQSLLEVMGILDGYFVSGGLEQQIQEVLERVPLPNFARNFAFEVKEDNDGDPALQIWIFVDESAEREGFAERAWEVRQNIHQALIDAKIDYWPYVYFRTVAEQRAL